MPKEDKRSLLQPEAPATSEEVPGVYRSLNFRSLQDPYSHRGGDTMASHYSTLRTDNLESMLNGGLEKFYKKYNHLSRKVNLQLPTPEVRFQDLSFSVQVPESVAGHGTVGSHLAQIFTPWQKVPMKTKHALHPMTGIIKPGSMTLILANPGAGKSTFLKALAGNGGERKRVTVGEVLVGGQSLFLCDEISTGLDSAATFDIVKSMRTWCKTLGGSVIVALLQPTPEVVEMFDDIFMVHEGHMVYHGPRFTCPPRVDPADFLIEVTSGRGHRYANGSVETERLPVTPEELNNLFCQSNIFRKTSEDISKGFNEHQFENAEDFQKAKSVANLARSKQNSEFGLAFIPSTMLLLNRQKLVWLRDPPLLWGKLIEALVIGLVMGMIYFNVSSTYYLRMIFFSIALFQRQAWQQITISFQLRKVFYKQRPRNFFRTTSYAIAESVVQIPVNVAWMSALMPNEKVANVAVGALSCLFNLFSGYLLPRTAMKAGYKWFQYVMPSSYSLAALVGVQFGDNQDVIAVPSGNTTTNMTVAHYIEKTYDFRPDSKFNFMAGLLVIWVVLQVAIYLTFKYVSHLKR
eukprot:jgi/Phyca11/537834/estExt2_fgenesh1_pg.C_PHYCAscaffold_2620002